MIGISKLYMGTVEPSDALRYGRHSASLPGHLLQFSKDKKPVVVWNCTRACNLRCVHCYASSDGRCADNELSFDEGRELIDNLADFGVPVLLFSGGEPLCRKDMPELAKYAVSKGMRAVVSTNGTLITDKMAERLKLVGLSYVGVSLDGMQVVNDKFRGVEHAFERALEGIRACKRAGIKVGLRYTLTRYNIDELPAIFQLLADENIPRVCFYHLVSTGRGSEIQAANLTDEQSRAAIDEIIDRTAEMHRRGEPIEVLTVDNHCDGPYLYLRLLRENRAERAEKVMELLEMNGGNSTGRGIGCVSWDGTVYPDQFWRHHPVGNVRTRTFGEIWSDPENTLLTQLREKPKFVQGRCRTCRFLDVCGGNFRARGEAATGDVWGVDPACYLTDEEIALPG